MVVQRTIDNLKDRPKDERKVVASGIAITVVVILFFGWAFLFFKRIQSGNQQLDLSSGAQEEFNFRSVTEAQQALEEAYGDEEEDYRAIRENAAANEVQGQQQLQIEQGPSDPFRTD